MAPAACRFRIDAWDAAGDRGFADLAADNLDALLDGHARFRGARAIRHMMNHIPGNPALCWADQDYIENPKWVANFPRLARFGLGFDLMCFSNQMQAMARLAQENPGIPVYLEHTGMPYDHTPAGVRSGAKGSGRWLRRPMSCARFRASATPSRT
jgi:predicted TIM-barrel fold metal-dependent hydrolase